MTPCILAAITSGYIYTMSFIGFVIPMLMVYGYYRLTNVKPAIIHNLDITSFLEGCRLASGSNSKDVNLDSLNPHALLGYKVTLLMSSGHFLNYDDKPDNYVVVIVGDDDKKQPHVAYKYKNRHVDSVLIEKFISRSCCVLKIRHVDDVPEGTSIINIKPQ